MDRFFSFCAVAIVLLSTASHGYLRADSTRWYQNLPAGLSNYMDPVSYEPLDYKKDTLIWLQVPFQIEGGQADELVLAQSFLRYQGHYWRPYKARTILQVLQTRFQQIGDDLREVDAMFTDPVTRHPVKLGDSILLSFGDKVELVAGELRLEFLAAEQADFFFGNFSSEGKSHGRAIHFNTASDFFLESEFVNWHPNGPTRMSFLEFENYYKEGEFLAHDSKLKTRIWHFPNGSFFRVLYDESGQKTGWVNMHTSNGHQKTIRFCEFPAYIDFH